jgi:hypothetical protein
MERALLLISLTLTQADVGKLPPGWQAAQTGTGQGSVWKVVPDTTAPSKSGLVLAQTASGPESLFNICVATKDRIGPRLSVSVSLRPMDGENDQGGGIVWLYQDSNNYYITRYNPLEDNFRVYKVVGGKRTQLQTIEKIAKRPGWHTISVSHAANKITCTLDNQHHLKVTDDTFSKPGLVGLWTKADARTHFDRFEAAQFQK